MDLLVSAVMGPAAQGLVGPRLLSEEEDETEPLRAEIALWPLVPLVPEATHCDCLHAARVACRDDLSGNATLSIPTTFHNTKHFIPKRLFFFHTQFAYNIAALSNATVSCVRDTKIYMPTALCHALLSCKACVMITCRW